MWAATGLLAPVLLASCFVVSCHRDTPEEPHTATESTELPPKAHLPHTVLPLLWTRLPLLPPGLQPNGWSQAVRAWEAATSAYADRKLESASHLFMEVAAALRNSKNTSRAERVSITGRCLAYENAGRALHAAQQTEQAKSLLREAAQTDPACKHSVYLRISYIARADATSTPIRRAGP